MQQEAPTGLGRWLAIPRGRIARDTAWNLGGQALPLVVGVLAVPVVVRHLSHAEFGLLGFAWALLGYVGLLDLGLGRATTRFVATSLASPGALRLRGIVFLSVTGAAAFGLLGGLLLIALAPWMARGFLGLSGAEAREAVITFTILAACVPLTLLAQAFRAVLEGARRFDLANAVRIPAQALMFLLPAVGAVAGLGVRGIVGLLVLARAGLTVGLWIAARQALPRPTAPAHRDPALLGEFARFSGWVAVSSVLSPLLVYAERFVLGAMSGLGAVAFYTPPAEAATRALVVPSSVASALFPVFSTADDAGRRAKAGALAARAVALLAAGLALPALAVVLFARPLLTLWLGADFAIHGAVALQVLAVGIFANSLAFVPQGFLQGIGRPDLAAKLNLAEVPPYLVLVWLLVSRYGIVGAAVAWTARLIVDAAGLALLAWLHRAPRPVGAPVQVG